MLFCIGMTRGVQCVKEAEKCISATDNQMRRMLRVAVIDTSKSVLRINFFRLTKKPAI